ncbi:MAG: HD domain-containing protein [Vicingaceae bacterium]
MKKSFKQKIFNDPIYGFISIPDESIYNLIEHPYFQRLRRIKQLGATHLVYPGALHTRFHHALGAMHLMSAAIQVLRNKGHEITEEERTSACIAILLHDIGHGPYSHSLEYILAKGMNHEKLSSKFMQALNKEMDGKLTMAIAIFNGKYQKNFLHQLVSSQLDVDRLDYLKRDSFYTGVSEGVISTDRIISMLDVFDDSLAVEIKGIYSIEKFLIARRLMYWQVYLHKTVIASEKLLINILRRAKFLAEQGSELFTSPSFKFFLYNVISEDEFESNPDVLKKFALLDDSDVFLSIKVWMSHEDRVLSDLASNFVNRELYKIRLQSDPFPKEEFEQVRKKFIQELALKPDEVDYYVFKGKIANNAYNPKIDRINILLRNDTVIDVTEAADQLNVTALSEPVEKHFICYPKNR